MTNTARTCKGQDFHAGVCGQPATHTLKGMPYCEPCWKKALNRRKQADTFMRGYSSAVSNYNKR